MFQLGLIGAIPSQTLNDKAWRTMHTEWWWHYCGKLKHSSWNCFPIIAWTFCFLNRRGHFLCERESTQEIKQDIKRDIKQKIKQDMGTTIKTFGCPLACWILGIIFYSDFCMTSSGTSCPRRAAETSRRFRFKISHLQNYQMFYNIWVSPKRNPRQEAALTDGAAYGTKRLDG